MKRFIFAAVCYFICSPLLSQNCGITTFDKLGRITKLHYEKCCKTNLHPANLQALYESDSILKKKARELMLPKVQESIRILKNGYYKKTLHIYYTHLWGKDTASLLSFLYHVEESLKTGKAKNSVNSVLKTYTTSFNKYLSIDKSLFAYYLKEKLGTTDMQLWEKNPFTSFITDLYNASLETMVLKNPDLRVKKEDLIEFTYRLIDEQKKVNNLLSKYRVIDTFNLEFYQALVNTHTSLMSNSSALQKSMNMFKQDWFKLWFWFRGGEIRLNPLDFTTNDSVTKYSYKNILDTTTFRKITSNNQSFILEDRLDTLIATNDANQSLLTITERLINKVTIPSKGNFHNFSAVTDLKLEQNKEYIEKPLDVKESKVIVVHNISKNAKAGIVEKDVAFNDRSAFQNGLDTVVSSLGQLAALYAQFATPVAGFLDFLLPTKKLMNSVIKPSSVVAYETIEQLDKNGHKIFGADKITKTKKIKIKKTTITIGPLKIEYKPSEKKQLFDSLFAIQLLKANAFDSDVFSKYFIKNETLEYVTKNIKQYEPLFKQYFTEITKKAADRIHLDSFNLANTINVYNRSTAPTLDPIETSKDTNALYYSKILETKPSEKAIEKEVTVFIYSNKDTSNVGKFTYKVGKRHRFALSAGLANTLTTYNQSTAVTNADGSIAITNNVQLYRLLLGLHVYLGKGLYNQNPKFWGKKGDGRTSAFIGIGIPRPLDNLYVGLARDLVPGLKLTAGAHFVRNNQYFIQNNSIQEERTQYQFGGPFIALQIDPTSLLSLFNTFNNLNK